MTEPATNEPETTPVSKEHPTTPLAPTPVKDSEKEEEADEPVSAEEEIAPDLLLRSGKNLVAAGEFEEGIDQLSLGLETMASRHGQMATECGPFYIEYAKALLRQAKKEEGVLTKVEEMAKKQLAGGSESKEEPEEDEKEPLPDTKSETPKEGEPTAEVTESKVDEGQGEEEENMTEGKELAWQLFETARVIYAKSDASDKDLRLADIHQSLGDVAVEDGNFDRGYEEFTAALKLFGTTVKLSDARIGETQQLAGMCALYMDQNQAAQFHYTAAAESYNMRLEELLTAEGVLEPRAEEEQGEDIEFVDKEVVEKLKTKLGETSAKYKDVAEAFSIMNDLIDRVEDLMAQQDEDQEKIQAIVAKLAGALGGAAAATGIAPGSAATGEPVPLEPPTSMVTEQNAFDAPTAGANQVNALGSFGKASEQIGFDAPTRTAPVATLVPSRKSKTSEKRPRPADGNQEVPDSKKPKTS